MKLIAKGMIKNPTRKWKHIGETTLYPKAARKRLVPVQRAPSGEKLRVSVSREKKLKRLRGEGVSKKLPLKSIPGIKGVGSQGKIAPQAQIPNKGSAQTMYNSAAKAADKAPKKPLSDARISAQWFAGQTANKVKATQQSRIKRPPAMFGRA